MKDAAEKAPELTELDPSKTHPELLKARDLAKNCVKPSKDPQTVNVIAALPSDFLPEGKFFFIDVESGY